MIDLNATNEWQHRDPDTGLVFPWYTKPALDEIVTWDLKDKTVFEYGCGASTLWWAAKCESVYAVESDLQYYLAVTTELRDEQLIIQRSDKNEYINAPKTFGKFDIIIIDGDYRDACVPVALDCLKPGGVLIFDNWMQPSVELQTEETQKLLLGVPHKIFKQPGHPDWQTLIAWKDH